MILEPGSHSLFEFLIRQLGFVPLDALPHHCDNDIVNVKGKDKVPTFAGNLTPAFGKLEISHQKFTSMNAVVSKYDSLSTGCGSISTIRCILHGCPYPTAWGSPPVCVSFDRHR